jgi:hypothetical protein
MRRQPVSSSVVRAVGYDRDGQVLEIEFHSGRLYRYFLVPHRIFAELMATDSMGRYFNESIRDQYPVRQVTK